MKISVVVPTYRRPELLRRCVEALLQQQFDKTAYEIIVVSDGPDSATRQALLPYQNAAVAFTYSATPQKKGPAAARNAGWKIARGKLIAFTDDDCIPDSNWLKDIEAAYQNEEEIVFTGSVKVPVSTQPTDYERNISNLQTAEFITANCACTKKSLQKTGGFDERFTIAWREDSDLHFRLLRQNIPIKKIKARVIHPVRQAPWGISLKEQKKGMFNALLYKKHPRLYRQRIKPIPSWNYYLMIISFLMAIAGILSASTLWTVIGLATWLFLLLRFVQKRLSDSSHHVGHVCEMIVTSIFIPFLSVYWQWYGAFRYRVLFL